MFSGPNMKQVKIKEQKLKIGCRQIFGLAFDELK